MTFQSVVDGVKGRVETLSTSSQKVAQISVDGFKRTGDIVADSIQTLVNDGTAAVKSLYDSVKSGLEKAKADGLKAVAAAPVSYLPPRDKLVIPFNNTVSLFTKTSDDLYKVAKDSLSSVKAEVIGTGGAFTAWMNEAAKNEGAKATGGATKKATAKKAAVKVTARVGDSP